MKKIVVLMLLAISSIAVHAASDIRVFKMLHLQRWGEALELARALSQSNPGDGQARSIVGIALLYNGNTSQAEHVFRELIAAYPKVSSSYNNLGVVFFMVGKTDEARKEFVAALALDPGHRNAKKNIDLLNAGVRSINISQASLDKRGIEFSSRSEFSFIPPQNAPIKAVTTNSLAPPVSAGLLSPEKESVVVNQRENNPFDEELKRQVFDALNTWITAWAKKDIGTYLSMYTSDFSPSNGISHSQWEQQRRTRILNRANIRVSAVDVVLEVGSSVAVVATFQQHYRADVLNEISNKMLVFIRDSETSQHWRIVDERTSY